MCVCGPASAKEKLMHHELIRVASKYPNIAKDYFYNKKHQTVEIIKLNGSVELAPIVGLAEVIVDICCCENDKTKLQLEDGGKMRNVRFSDIAILAKSKSEMKPIQNALQKCGIPFIRYKDDSLFSSMENAHWISMLQAINVSDFTGNNRKYLRKVLTTKFFGYSLKDITSDYFDRDDIKEIEILKNKYLFPPKKLKEKIKINIYVIQ